MKLKEFINALEVLAGRVDNPEKSEVRMADYILVTAPILKDNIVFITDSGE